VRLLNASEWKLRLETNTLECITPKLGNFSRPVAKIFLHFEDTVPNRSTWVPREHHRTLHHSDYFDSDAQGKGQQWYGSYHGRWHKNRHLLIRADDVAPASPAATKELILLWRTKLDTVCLLAAAFWSLSIAQYLKRWQHARNTLLCLAWAGGVVASAGVFGLSSPWPHDLLDPTLSLFLVPGGVFVMLLAALAAVLYQRWVIMRD